MTRKDILDKALTCVNGDRQDDYGSPENNFNMIAKLWNSYTRSSVEFTAKDVAAMLILLKIARVASGKKADNWVDIAGYAACGGEIESDALVLSEEETDRIARDIRERAIEILNTVAIQSSCTNK